MSMYNWDDESLATNLDDLKDELIEMKYQVEKRYNSDDTDLSYQYLERVWIALGNLIDII